MLPPEQITRVMMIIGDYKLITYAQHLCWVRPDAGTVHRGPGQAYDAAAA